jgi:hypothetical protein
MQRLSSKLKESNENNESGVWDVGGAKKKNVLVKELDVQDCAKILLSLFGNSIRLHLLCSELSTI